ncbi:MAG: hypothetical protein ACXWVK_02005, partial [Rhodoplanes sp.]
MMAIDRNSRSLSASVGKRPALRAFSKLPYVRSSCAAPVGPTPPRRARQFVGRIAAQRDEIRHLLGIDAVSRADLGGTDARHLACAHRVQDGRALGGELEGVAIAACDEDGSAPSLFGGN